MTAHTPGPWTSAQFVTVETGEPLGHDGAKKYVAGCIDKGGPEFYGVVCEKPDGPADVCHTGNGPTSAANARLIAAAPDLLEALQALGPKPDGYCFCINQEQIAAGHTGECREARAAIDKAMGQ